MSDEPEDEEIRQAAITFLAAQEPDEGALRWTLTTVFIDLFNAIGLVFEALGSFFSGQSRSLAARASLKEELKDHALRQQLKAEERRRMQLHTMEDIAFLPGSPE